LCKKYTEEAADKSEDQNLEEIYGDDLGSARAETFENSYRPPLLLDERTRDVPDPDAPEHQNEKPGKRKIILCASELLAKVFLSFAVRLNGDRRPFQTFAQLANKLGRIICRAIKNPPPYAARISRNARVIEREADPRSPPRTG
jgi:hypothetical protein